MTGPQLRALREKANVGQRAIAKAARVSPQSVVNFEAGGIVSRDIETKLVAAYAKVERLPKRKYVWGSNRVQSQGGDIGYVEGMHNPAWLRVQIEAWQREAGLTIIETRQAHPPEASVTRAYIVTAPQLKDLGRRLVLSMTGKNLE